MRRGLRIRSVPPPSEYTPAVTLDRLEDDQCIDERLVSQLMAVSLSWVRKQRLLNQGPPYIKLGKAVRYPVRGLRKWLAALDRHSSAAEQ